MNSKPDWAVEGRDWPNRAYSRFVEAGDLRWHVQIMGEGPPLVLLHGTGAATHSWRDLAPLLSRHHTIIAPDLPGHGFTATPARGPEFSLPAVARGIAALLRELEIAPHALVGHSAGAAISVRMALDGMPLKGGLVGLNAALLPFPGPLGPWAPLMAQTLFANPIAINLFALRAAMPGAIADLIARTGSALDARGLQFYERLFRKKGHLESAIGLMAHWDLFALKRDMPNLRAPLTLIAGDRDRAVPPSAAHEVQEELVRHAHVVTAQGGHLVHEEAPEATAGLILSALQQSEVRP